MDDYEIEQFVSERVRGAIEEAVSDCLREPNESGSRFAEVPEAIYEWIDLNANRTLQVVATLGVSVSTAESQLPDRDPLVERYLEIAASGRRKMARVLNELEGDIANGGFSQLLDNKGAAFTLEAIGYLDDIGAREAAAIVEEALNLFNTNQALLTDYDKFLRKLDELDMRFYALTDSIPHLYLEFSQREKDPPR
jgi:hypothetical protein